MVWSREYDCCRQCGRTDVKHQAQGYCRGCYRKMQYNKGKDKNRQRWSRKYECCIKCGTTTVIHAGHGLCRTCASLQHRKEHLDHYHEIEQIRRNKKREEREVDNAN